MIDIENHKIKNELNTYRIRGTVLDFLLLVRSADPADRRCDRQTDGQTDKRSSGSSSIEYSETKFGIQLMFVS